MKRATPKLKANELSAAVGGALRRQARVARKVAKMYGTRVWAVKNGKVVAEWPQDTVRFDELSFGCHGKQEFRFHYSCDEHRAGA